MAGASVCRRVALLASLVVCLLGGVSCVSWPAGREPRAPAVRTEAEAAAFLSGRPSSELALRWIESTEQYVRYEFSLEVYSDAEADFVVIRGDYYRTRRAGAARGGSTAPLLAVSPILAGPVDDYLASRFICRWACSRGISAFFLHQDRVILDPERHAIELESWLRDNVRSYRLVLDRFAKRPEVDRDRLGSFGVSLGAIKNVLLVTSEPLLRGNVFGLVGGGFARMLGTSRERLVSRYVAWRARWDGADRSELQRELRVWLLSEPLGAARSVAADRAFFFLGRWDDKVPFESGLELRRAAGDPAAYVVPLGHYTALVAAPAIAVVAFDWLEGRWRRP